MALLMCEGFDAYTVGAFAGTMKWSAAGGTVVAGCRAGGSALGGQVDLFKWLDPAPADWGLGIRYWWPGTADTIAVGYADEYSTPRATWSLATDLLGRLQVVGASFHAPGPMWYLDVALFTSSVALVPNAWNYIELKSVSGVGTVKINGSAVGTGSMPADELGGLAVGLQINSGQKVDDFYLISIDAETPDLFGDVAVLAFTPVEDRSVEWSPLTGAENWPMVDEIPTDEDTTYNYTDEVDKTDLFGLDPGAPLDPTLQVYGVQLAVRAEKINTASIDLQPVIVSATLESAGAQHGLAVGYSTFIHPLASDPGISGGQPWTVAAMLAADYGYRSKAPAG